MALNFFRRAASAVTAALFLTAAIPTVSLTANAKLSGITSNGSTNADRTVGTIDKLGACNYAKIVMEAPDSTLEFKNITENDLQTQKIINYAGTVEADGETYLVARKKGSIMYNTTLAEIETDHNDYIFYHVCSEESLPAEGFAFPFYELIQSAKHFGLVTGKLSSAVLDGSNYDCNCELSALQNKDKEISCKVYSEISKRYMGYIILDGYDFYSPEYYVMRGSEMTARPNGCFTINAKEYELMYTENCVDSYVEKNLSRTSAYELNAKNNITIDYRVSDSLEGKYGIVYKFYLHDIDPDKRISFSIAEKVSGMSVEELFGSYEKSMGIGNQLSFVNAELVKTYTANGHEYDLYKGLYRYRGEISSYNEESYIAVRKDTGDSASYGSSIDVYAHMSNTEELSQGTEVYSVEFSFHNCGAAGTLDLTRNDISFGSGEAPAAKTADLQAYEYVFEDANIQNVSVSEEYCSVTLTVNDPNYEAREWGGFGGMSFIELCFCPNTLPPDTDPDDTDWKADIIKKNRALLSMLHEGSKATISVFSYSYFPELVSRQYKSGAVYNFEGVISVKSPDIHCYGDINDDGVVDSYDAIVYRKQLSGNTTEKLNKDQLLNGDINFNGVIDGDDLRQLQDYLLGIQKEFNAVTEIGSIRLDDKVDVLASEGKVSDADFAYAEMDLGVKLMKNCFDPTQTGKENFLISPVSISTALSMTANGADGKTRDEMEKLLGSGLTIDQINEYMAYFVKELPDKQNEKVYLANSIWFKNTEKFKVNDKFLETNKKYYSSEIYKSAFDDSTVKDVNSWVNTNTKGMIPVILNKGDLETKGDIEKLMLLINTLYFEADWSDKYTTTYSGKFTDLNGAEHDVTKMSNTEYEYFDLGDADAFKKPYAGGNYSFVGILPRDNDIVGYVNSLDSKKLFDSLKECEDPSEYDLTVIMPKFNYSFDTSLKDVLEQMGMTTAFDHNTADFTKMYDATVPYAPILYIGDVLHKTKIEVTESGTKAAAVTVAGMDGWGGMSPQKKKEIIIDLDRPFVYMIVDKNNIPLFIGAASMIEE